MANPTPAQVAQARQIVAWHIGLDDELSTAIASALATAHAEGRQERGPCVKLVPWSHTCSKCGALEFVSLPCEGWATEARS